VQATERLTQAAIDDLLNLLGTVGVAAETADAARCQRRIEGADCVRLADQPLRKP
jgi:hypothetical protein